MYLPSSGQWISHGISDSLPSNQNDQTSPVSTHGLNSSPSLAINGACMDERVLDRRY